VEIDAILALNRDLSQKMMAPPPQMMNNHMLSSKTRVRIQLNGSVKSQFSPSNDACLPMRQSNFDQPEDAYLLGLIGLVKNKNREHPVRTH